MKKCAALVLVILVFSLFTLTVYATPPEQPFAPVYVSITDETGIVLAAEEYRLYNTTYSLDSILNDIHSRCHKDGAAAYGTENSPYGVSLTKLWGVETGAFGYQLIDKNGDPISVYSLADTISPDPNSGDSYQLYAYAYTDLVNFSDTFSYFDKARTQASRKDSVTLTLNTLGYDKNWNTVQNPLADAVITINGKETALKTDENGTVTIPVDQTKDFTVSAKKDGMVLVPPVCVVEVAHAPNFVLISVIAVLGVAGVLAVVLFVRRRKAEGSAK